MARFGFDRRSGGALAGIAVFLAVMMLVAAIFLIARNERAFELDRWQARLKAGSAQPMRMLNDWLSEGHAGLRAVAVNPTVQIYLTEMAVAKYAPESVPNADVQLAFLSNYVASLGFKGAFASSPGSPGDTGLAVFDARRHLVAATVGFRPGADLVAALVASLKNGDAKPRSLGGGRVAFESAILPIQGPGAPVGYVIGVRKMGSDFWTSGGSMLSIDEGHESLVATGPPTALIGTSLSAHRSLLPVSVESLAALHPLNLQRARGISGRDTLAVGVPVTGTNWVLVESVPSRSALAGVEARIRNLVLILLLSLLAIVLGVLALWRHMAAQQQIAARENSLRTYRGTAELLLDAIDQRDPGAAEHSRRVAELSRKMAQKLSSRDIDAVELAGSLMNVGKLFVPAELLTKRGILEKTETSLFEEGNARWLALLARTSFDPPIEPILRGAYWIGHGGADGAVAIGQDAYIVATANIAVALMSVRAYRMAHSPNETIEIIRQSGIPVPEPVLAALSDEIRE